MSLDNKTYIVAGCSGGIGKTVVDKLSQLNANVIGLSRSSSASAQQNYQSVFMDFDNIKELEKTIKTLEKSIEEVDGIICAAGVGRFGAVEQFSLTQMQSVMNVNFLGQVYLVRTFLPKLKRQKHGDIIFIGSEAGLSGGKNGALYCASKFAVRGFSQALREECGKSGVRVSLINPGMVKTGFFDGLDFAPGQAAENYIEPEDIAECVALILSTRSGTVLDEINLSPLKKVIDFHGNS